MARRGENIYKRKDNRWEGRYIKGHDQEGKAQFGYVYAKTYREVKAKLTEARKTSAQKPKQNIRNFGFFCDEWLQLSRNRVKESTYVKYYNVITRRIKPGLGNYPVSDINSVKIENFSNELLKQGLSPKTIRDILTVLRAVIKHCRSHAETGVADIEVIYPKERHREMRVLTIEEQNLLVEYLLTDMDTVKFGVLLALLTGMRIGELCALRWRDISIEDKIINITSTMQRLQNINGNSYAKTKIVIGDTKSISSNRIIPLTEQAAALCKKMKKEADAMAGNKTSAGEKNIPDDAFILTGRSDIYFEPRLLQYRLKKYTAQCGLEGVHFHTLRHTFATRCVEVGFEIKSLSEVLGHSSTKVTLDRYVHPSLELKRVNMDKLAAVGL